MHHSRYITLKHCLAILALAPLLLTVMASAAELGDAKVASFIGQPLAADIELVALSADDVAGLDVRLASTEVYRGASISMNPALQGLRIGVVKRDQRQFLHLTSQKPVEAEHLHLFLTLSAGGRSDVRAVTLWLAPNPQPVAAPVPAVASAAAVLATPIPPPAAVVTAVATPVSEPVHVPAKPATAPLAPVTTVPAPMAPPASATIAPAALAPALPRHAMPTTAVVSPLASHADAPAASCAPRAADGAGAACRALDRKNQQIGKKLSELEGKLKALQSALSSSEVMPAQADAVQAVAGGEQHAASAHSASASSEQHAEAAHPASASAVAHEASVPHVAPKPLVKRALVPLKAKAKAEVVAKKTDAGGMAPTTLLGIGVGALLLVIGLGVHFWRRRKNKRDQVPSAPNKYWVLLRHPWRRRRKTDAFSTAQPAGEAPATEVAEPAAAPVPS